MSDFEVERAHDTDKETAVERIDRLLDRLAERDWPYGVKIIEPEKSWDDGTMRFSFKGKKGILKATISGNVHVDDERARLEMSLPGALTKLVKPEKIEEVIIRRFNELFDDV